MPMLSILRITIYPDSQEQIIIASPKQRNEGSQDSGLENSTPEVSPPGDQSRTHWRSESASSGSDKITPSSETENMTQQRFISSKRSLAPSPPTEETPVTQSFSNLSFQQPETPTERNASANFICRKDHSEAAICKAVVAQGALEEVSGTFKAAPNQKHGKFSSVRIEIEATRENHAKVAAVKTVPAKEFERASAHFKPMCEVIDENLQKQQRPQYSAESSISPASSSRSSDFGADNGSLDRMSFGSSNAGHSSGGDYKVVALDAKPQPGKLTEFVPEVERTKRNDSYLVSSLGSNNSSPPPDAAVVRNWELSDEEQQQNQFKGYTNNNEKKVSVDRKSNEQVKYEPAYVPLAKSQELEFSSDIPKVVLPPLQSEIQHSDSVKSISSIVSAKSISNHSEPEALSPGNPIHSDTDSLQSPEPLVKTKREVQEPSSDEESPEVIQEELSHITQEESPYAVYEESPYAVHETADIVHESSSSEDHLSKTKSIPEEETLHYAESNIQLNHLEQEEEQQYANINQDTLRSNTDESDYMNDQSRKAEWVTPIEAEDMAEYNRRTPQEQPLFYDTVARYGFDTSGGYHVPKQVYRRDVPIRIEEPRHDPQKKVHVGTPWTPHPFQKLVEEEEAQISRVTYRFYDRNMRELSSNTLVDRARRASRSFENGIEHPIEQLDTPYYPQSGSADRKWIRSQGYPTPFDASSKNYVNADSKFRILPKDENRSRPIITKVQQTEMPPYGLTETRRVYNDSRHPSGAPQQRPDLFSEEPKPAEKSQTLLTVSGKLRCGHCTCELGRGSAMIIEALGLFYHINCFCCHVCEKPLGNGNQTTDVRVRDGKLHCEKCYSNEEIGVRLSEV